MTRCLTRLTAVLVLLLVCSGCPSSSPISRVLLRREKPPVLSTDISPSELIQHVNQQREGLQNWRSQHTILTVSGPGIPVRQKLSGHFICSAPHSFRLSAGNMLASVDFGANTDHCWAWAQPGAPAILTWPHEDAYLLHELPGELPWLEAEWLAAVAGITPIDATEFTVQSSPQKPLERSLTRTRQSGAGAVKDALIINLMTGNCEEALAYDHEGRLMVRARLLKHQFVNGRTLPQEIAVHAVQAGFQLNLRFDHVLTNVTVEEKIWNPPAGENLQVVDLSDLVRSQQSEPQVSLPGSEPQLSAPRFDSELPIFDDENTIASTRRFRWPWEWWR